MMVPSWVRFGIGATLIVNTLPVEEPPFAAGFSTVTWTAPAAASWLGTILAVSCVGLTNVVARLAPFHCSTEPVTKLLPVTVSSSGGSPAVALAGLKPVILGGVPGATLTLNGRDAVVPVLEVTLTCGLPAVARSVAGIAAVNCVGLTKVVVRGEPFHCTTEPAVKFCPVTVRVRAGAPTVAEAGAIELSVAALLAGPNTCNSPIVVKYAPPPGAPSMRIAVPVMGEKLRT